MKCLHILVAKLLWIKIYFEAHKMMPLEMHGNTIEVWPLHHLLEAHFCQEEVHLVFKENT